VGFSDALHEAALKLNPIVWLGYDGGDVFDVTYAQATEEYGYVGAKEAYPEYRRFLQVLGTEVGRDMFGENVWVDIMADKIEALHNEGKNVVVTGIRFPNELGLIENLGGTSVWVSRPPQNALDAVVPHASENSVTSTDFAVTLRNDKTLPDLYIAADGLIANLNGD
jgi:hypothetical protein